LFERVDRQAGIEKDLFLTVFGLEEEQEKSLERVLGIIGWTWPPGLSHGANQIA